MSEPPKIQAEWRGKVPVLTASYTPTDLFEPRSAKLLSESLVDRYRELIASPGSEPRPKACILVIASDVAGSPVVRAIFELYKVVHASAATLYCVNYPENYMHSLTSLGLPALPGFQLAETLSEADGLIGKDA